MAINFNKLGQQINQRTSGAFGQNPFENAVRGMTSGKAQNAYSSLTKPAGSLYCLFCSDAIC